MEQEWFPSGQQRDEEGERGGLGRGGDIKKTGVGEKRGGHGVGGNHEFMINKKHKNWQE